MPNTFLVKHTVYFYRYVSFNSQPLYSELHLMTSFLAHLAQSAKVSFWDDPLSVVRRPRRPSSVVRRQQFT